MQTLLEFLKKYSYWLLFLLLEVISLALLLRFNSYQSSVWFTSANTAAGTVNSWYTEAVAYFNLKTVNTRLNQENFYLQQQVGELRSALDKANERPSANQIAVNDTLRGYTLISATVVSNSLHKANNFIVIDKGSDDGVKTDMGVVGGGGVVGIVSLAGRHYSLVLPTINVKSNISCRVRHRNYFGYLQWNGGSTTTAFLNDVPRYAKIKAGEYIETSGYSTVFPPGIFVGKVTSVCNAPDGLSLQLKLNLGTDFGCLSDVCVIANEHRPEIDNLQEKLMNSDNPM